MQVYKTVPLEVIAVVYERCSFTRLGTNYKALTEKDLVIWIGVRLREVVTHGNSTVFVCAIIIFWITISFYYVSFCCRNIFNNIIISQVTI